MSIKSFLSSLTGLIRKSDVEIDLTNSIDGIAELIETVDIAIGIDTNYQFTDKENLLIVKSFYDQLKHSQLQASLTIDHQFWRDLRTLLDNVYDNSKRVIDMSKEFKANIIATSTMSAVGINSLRSVSHYAFIVDYGNELVNFLVANEVKSINKTDTLIPRATYKFIKEYLHIFVALLAVYGSDPKEFGRRVNGIPKVILNKEEGSRLDAFLDERKADLTPGVIDNFIGNPIYAWRSGSAARQADRYHKRVDLKNLTQSRLLHFEELKSRQESGEGVVSASTQKEIDFLQAKVNKLNAQIQKDQESVQ